MAHANSKRWQRCAALLPFADFNRKAPAQLDLFEDGSAQHHGEPDLPEGWKRCGSCLEPKPAAEFHRHRQSPDGRQHWCKACKANNQRFRRATHWGKRRTAAYDKRSASRPENRQKAAARRAAANARCREQRPKPDRCAVCQRQGVPLQDDHYAGYEPEHFETVAAICLSCDADRQRPMRGPALLTKNYGMPLFPAMDAAYWSTVERQLLPPFRELP